MITQGVVLDLLEQTNKNRLRAHDNFFNQEMFYRLIDFYSTTIEYRTEYT